LIDGERKGILENADRIGHVSASLSGRLPSGHSPRGIAVGRLDVSAAEPGDHVGWGLDQLDQDAFAGQRRGVVGLGVDEADVVAGGAAPDAAGCEPHVLLGEPGDGGGEVVDPEADVVERRLVDLGLAVGVDRLHEVDLDAAEGDDVLVDVLALAAERAGDGGAEQIDPEPAQRGLARPADGDLLHAEHAERPGHRRGSARTSARVRSPGRGALTRIAMLPEGWRLSRISWWHAAVSANGNTRDRQGSTLPAITRSLAPRA